MIPNALRDHRLLFKISFYSLTFILLFLNPVVARTTDPYQLNNIALAYEETEGFTFQNATELMTIGGYLEIDGRLFIGRNQPKSTFLVRQARFFITGELYDMFGYMFMPQWDRQVVVDLEYAWISTLRPSWAQVRFGQFKTPFSLQGLKSDLFRNVLEPTMVVHNFNHLIDIGIMVFGETSSKRFAYSLGFFNGNGKHLDNNSNKEVIGRLVTRLFNSRRFGRVYFGFAGASGKQDANLTGTTFVTETFTPFWEWNGSTAIPVVVHHTRLRGEMDIEWLAGPFYFCAEYQYTTWGRVRHGSLKRNFWGTGGYAQMSYLLTGEEKPRDGPVIPNWNIDPCKNQWGAWEIGMQYEIFYASKEMIKVHFAQGANYLHGPIIFLNWYLNPRMAIKLDGQYIWFNRRANFNIKHYDHETNIIVRAQAVF